METTHLGLKPLLPSKRAGGPYPFPTAGGAAWALPCGCRFPPHPPLQSEPAFQGPFPGTFSFWGDGVGRRAPGKDLQAEPSVGAPAERMVSFVMMVTLSTLGTWDHDPRGLCPPSMPPRENHRLPASQPGVWGQTLPPVTLIPLYVSEQNF